MHPQVVPDANVVGMPDSGFFLDYEEETRKFHTGLTFVFNEMNASAGVDQGCIADLGSKGEAWKCIFAQVNPKPVFRKGSTQRRV